MSSEEDVIPPPTAVAAPNGSTSLNGAAAAGDAAVATAATSTTSTTCAGCGAPLASDQRYCLACGRPASPVRLAFLDVLQGEYQTAAPSGTEGFGGPPPAGYHYASSPDPDGLIGALRRYSGLFGLLGVLLASLLIGLLVGHWITGSGSGAAGSGKQVIEVKGLSGPLAAAAPAVTSTTPAGSSPGSSSNGSSSAGSSSKSHSSAKEAAKEEVKEAKEVNAVKAPPVVHKKTSSQSLQKLNKTTGKQHAKEVNELIKGDEPIETGH
jgi:hypothetical protein